ncbi:MAG: DUF3828 domain-containing protein [Chloroflexi bacterium]|nr:DUF3828 domain-containing protein [Chloroflexota bacterium]
MFSKFLSLVLIGAVLALAAAPATAQGGDPADVVSSFYGWLFDYGGYDEGSGEFRNPLVDGSYAERPEVSPDLVAQIDAIREAESGFHYDPLTCAQDVAESFAIAAVMQGEDASASVLVETYFGWNPHPNPFLVTLRQQSDGGWQITGVNCQETVTPRGVAEAFYNWYLAQVPGGEAQAERSPLLTDDLNARLAEARSQRELGGGDPVLCAQDIPSQFAVDEVMVGQAEATMVVREFFSGNPDPRLLTVKLVYDQQWLIDNIVCEVAPETIVELLYNEYILHTSYDLQRGIERTPLADWGVYPWAEYMGEALLADLLEIYRGAALRPADPFLCAQDLPMWVTAEPVQGPQSDSVTVQVLGMYSSGPASTTDVLLAEARMTTTATGDWQMVDITCAQ